MRQISIESIHAKLVSELEKDIILYTSKRLGHEPKFTKDEIHRLIFANYRLVEGEPFGIRLTSFGNALLSKRYDHYKYKFSDLPNNKAVIVLDKIMEWPYYLGKSTVTFYNENDATWFRLNGNDINSYIEML